MQGSNFHPQTTYWFKLQVSSQHPPGSFQRVFWEQQQRATKLKKKESLRSMRDDPVVLIFGTSIRQCLRAPPRIRCCHFTFSEDPPGLYILHKSCSWVFRYTLLRALSSSQNHFPYTYVDGVDEQLMLVGNLAIVRTGKYSHG